jgi:hypothetical protein
LNVFHITGQIWQPVTSPIIVQSSLVTGDDGAARPPDPPLRHRRDWQRKLALQEPNLSTRLDLSKPAAVLAAVKHAARRLRPWPTAMLDCDCARRLREIRPGRRNGLYQPNKETSLFSYNQQRKGSRCMPIGGPDCAPIDGDDRDSREIPTGAPVFAYA